MLFAFILGWWITDDFILSPSTTFDTFDYIKYTIVSIALIFEVIWYLRLKEQQRSNTVVTTTDYSQENKL